MAPLDPTERQDVDLLLGVFSGVIAATPAEYPQMALKELEVRYATKRQKDYIVGDDRAYAVQIERLRARNVRPRRRCRRRR